MADPFVVPRDGIVYRERVFNRSRDLIHLQVWSGMQIGQLDGWIANFVGETEKYFAACLLDSLIYRSNPQTFAMLRQLFQRSIPDLAREQKIQVPALSNCMSSLHRSNDSNDPKVRLVPAMSSSDPYSKSGATIVREVKRRLRLSEKWQCRAEDVQRLARNGVQAFVFIDDFLGTGKQFSDFLGETRVADVLRSVPCIYAPLVAHESGITRLNEDFPDLHVTAVEYLTPASSFFSPQMPWFNDGKNSPASAKEFYYELLVKKGIEIIGPDRRGFGAIDYAYAFEHASPDNSIPLLWWHESSTWRPLFDR